MKGTADDNIKFVRLIKPDAHAASTINGSGVDCKGFGELLVGLDIGDANGGTATLSIEESDDNSSFSAVTGATFGAKTTENQWVGRVNLEKRKRYIRASVIVAAATMDLACTGALVPNKDLPVSQVNSTVFDV